MNSVLLPLQKELKVSMKKQPSAASSEKSAILQEIANVIDIEIEALQSVRQQLGPEFEEAVKTIAACTGCSLPSG